MNSLLTSHRGHCLSKKKPRKLRKIKCHQISCHNKTQVVVIGAGAAGLTAAYFASNGSAEVRYFPHQLTFHSWSQPISHLPPDQHNLQVLVLEKTKQAGNKILISGGSRCNILPSLPSLDPSKDFSTSSSLSALKAVLKSWTLAQCREWLSQDIGIHLTLEEDSQKLFPTSNSAVEVRDKLIQACTSRGVSFQYNARLKNLTPILGQPPSSSSSSLSWVCELEDGQCITADSVVIATGGLSFPKLGTTGDGYPILKRLGHAIQGPPYPALTPLLAKHPGDENLAGLSLQSSQLTVTEPIKLEDNTISEGGLGVDVTQQTTTKKKKKKHEAYRKAMLFTHRGLSGPAILDQSHFFTTIGPYLLVNSNDGNNSSSSRSDTCDDSQSNASRVQLPELTARWIDTMGAQEWEEQLNLALNKTNAALTVGGVLRRNGIPQRLTEALCTETKVPTNRKLTELKKGERVRLVQALSGYVFEIVGDEGFGKAEVTGGGVALSELDSRTMESKIYPGLYVIGELCDVFGRIGGFNFAWAWYTGRLAGMAVGGRDGV